MRTEAVAVRWAASGSLMSSPMAAAHAGIDFEVDWQSSATAGAVQALQTVEVVNHWS